MHLEVKHVRNTFTTYVYSYRNICNIKLKYWQHIFKTTEHYKCTLITHVSNLLLHVCSIEIINNKTTYSKVVRGLSMSLLHLSCQYSVYKYMNDRVINWYYSRCVCLIDSDWFRLGKIRHCYHGRLESLSIALFWEDIIRITTRVICYYLLAFIH